jgi:hypothetical protein
VYQALGKIKPDLVLVKHRPDRLVDDFRYMPLVSEYNEGEEPKHKFDIGSYINQLVVNGHQLVYNYKTYKQVIKHLLKEGIFVKTKYPEESEADFKKRLDQIKEFGELDLRDKFSPDLISTVGLWAISHNTPIVLSDLPDYIFRR